MKASERQRMHRAAPRTADAVQELAPCDDETALMEIAFERVVPILRIFDVAKAREFYVDFLDFAVDWEHRFEPALPLYMQISRGNVVLHLSEHHGDGSPGVRVRVETTGVERLQRQLLEHEYGYGRPSLERAPWGELILETIDPFGNRLVFCERIRSAA